MDTSKLEARRKQALQDNKVKQGIAGSGFHDNDPGSPQNQGLGPVSKNLVYFLDEANEEMVFAGACADKALEVLETYVAQFADRPAYELTGTEQKLVNRYVPRLKKGEDGLLRVKASQWNDVLHGLYAQGQGVTGLPMEVQGDGE